MRERPAQRACALNARTCAKCATPREMRKKGMRGIAGRWLEKPRIWACAVGAATDGATLYLPGRPRATRARARGAALASRPEPWRTGDIFPALPASRAHGRRAPGTSRLRYSIRIERAAATVHSKCTAARKAAISGLLASQEGAGAGAGARALRWRVRAGLARRGRDGAISRKGPRGQIEDPGAPGALGGKARPKIYADGWCSPAARGLLSRRKLNWN